MQKEKIIFALKTISIIAIILGSLDPLEGFILIWAGSILLAIEKQISNHEKKKIFLLSALLISVGAMAMIYFTMLGGIGGGTDRSAWLGLFVLPYPIGLLLLIILLVRDFILWRKHNKKNI